MKVAICCASSHGQTEKIGEKISIKLKKEGFETVVLDCSKKADTEVRDADAIIIGSRVQVGKHHAKAIRFVKKHLSLLQQKPSALFTVCLSARNKSKKDLEEIEKYQVYFKEKTGWLPELSATFAGALAYTKYNSLIRALMKKISEQQGNEVDVTKDYEFTDWNDVNAFAGEFVSQANEEDED